MRLFFAVFLLGCSASAEPSLLIAAAADLAPEERALTEFLSKAAGFRVQFTFAGSGALARQIAQGAPFDLFLSADEERIREGVAAGWLARGSERVYATGRIALWSASGSIKDVKQLTGQGIRHIAIANPAVAPYGKAARQALERSGIWPQVESRIVLGENIRQAFRYAETGNADAAIVSWTFVHDRAGVLLDARLHDPIRQSGAVVAASARQAQARRILELLLGGEGQRVLQAGGLFGP
jgi:molybdate transport system substrate-binding protein